MTKKTQIIVLIIALTALFSSQKFMQTSLKVRPFDVKTSGLYGLPPSSLLNIISLGHQSTLADYFWINLILTIGDTHHHHHHDDHHHGHACNHTEEEIRVSHYLHEHLENVLPDYIETITELDPEFTYPYLIGFLYMMTDYSNDAEAIRFLKKAMKYNPDYWEFPYFYAFYLNRQGGADDSLVLALLKKSVLAEKSVRVFEKELVYDTYIAFYDKLHPDIQSDMLLEGVMEAFDNPELKAMIEERYRSKGKAAGIRLK